MEFNKWWKKNKNEDWTKWKYHPFVKEYYSKIFNNEKPINLLEIGIREGISLFIHSRYFSNGEITGVDISDFSTDGLDNVTKFVEDAYTNKFLKKLKSKHYDIIIDDGSHELEHQKFFINNFIPKLKVGGKLVIEDVGCMDGTTTTLSPDECIKILEDEIKKLNNVSYSVFDFREKGIDYSIIIEIVRLK